MCIVNRKHTRTHARSPMCMGHVARTQPYVHGPCSLCFEDCAAICDVWMSPSCLGAVVVVVGRISCNDVLVSGWCLLVFVLVSERLLDMCEFRDFVVSTWVCGHV